MKKIVSIVLVIALLVSTVGCGASGDKFDKLKDKTAHTAETVANAAISGYHTASDFAEQQAERAKKAMSGLSLPDFQKGFESAASFFGTTIASVGGQKYVKEVAQKISDLETSIVNRVSAGPIESQAGFVAEEWHAGTFNIDAAARGEKITATTGKSNGLGSSDITLSDGTKASSKYYKTAEASAQQQAKNYIERYSEYCSRSTNPLSMEDWLTSNGIDISTESPELYWSIYKDQVRIIPKDQLDEAIKCLNKSVETNLKKEGVHRKYVADADLETLQNLTDRLKASNGTESIPLSKEEAEAIAKAAQEGDFTAAEFGVTMGGAIRGSYIAKQALRSGATAAGIQAAMVLGPEIYQIIKFGIENGELDEEQLKTAGIDGLSAAGDGFLKGSISNALIIMFQAGKFGKEYVNASPELVGATTVLVIDSIRYGIMMANGKITTAEYADLLVQEVAVGAGSMGSAALVGMIFPQATLAIMIGGFVGGLVVSAGYTVGKTYALAMIDSADVNLLVPIKSTAEAIKDVTEDASIKVKDAVSDLKDTGSALAKNVTIKVYDLTSKNL